MYLSYLGFVASAFLLVANTSMLCAQTRPQELAKQGVELVRERNYAAASERFEQAISASPWDKGTTYSVSNVNEQSFDRDQERLRYGEAQLSQILRDRPHMDAHGIRNSSIAIWCARRLAGMETGMPIRWSSDFSKAGGSAVIMIHRDVGMIELQIDSYASKRDKNARFEESWESLVYELIHAAQWREETAFDDAAMANEVSRTFYIKEMFRSESHATEKCRAFYVRMFLPWAAAAGFECTPGFWYTGETKWEPTNDQIRYYSDQEGYPWKPWGDNYDLLFQYGQELRSRQDAQGGR